MFISCFPSAGYANPFEDTIRILESRTSFHWGRDCLVWVVHYPEELVDPWVESEAGRTGMTESERRSYKEGFVSELSIDKAEPFLFTVYAFGPRALSFSPFSEKIALVTAEGKRVKPIRYDKVLDQPINGVVQGLFFFPKQERKDFALAVQGMGVYDERIFAFSESPVAEGAFVDADTGMEDSENVDAIIVELPPAQGKSAPPVPKRASRASTPNSAANKNPQPAAPAQPKPAEPGEPEIVVVEPEESQSMADFVEAMRSGGEKGEKGEKDENRNPLSEGSETQKPDKAYSSREKTVRAFLELWVKHDTETMYSMLSESSQKLFSKETFESELRKASDFRGALRDGYTLNWLGVERAKIVAVKRMLLIRTLASRTLGVVREGSDWKIVW